MDDAKKLRRLLRYILSGNNWESIVFYIIIFYLIIFYAAMPAVYAFTPLSDVSAVVSGSMVHSYPAIQVTYYDWLKLHGFNSSITSAWPFKNGIPVGSIAIAYKVPPSSIKVGDVIIYYTSYDGLDEDIIHRVINETNPYSLPFEYNVPYSSVVGKVEYVVPYLGYPKYAEYLLSRYI
ncbi:MAG: S26 family signal peptidase [Candidatus Parvarchaeota archaeon]|nr:S26 family signal peptidase [Candidatus Parvarchaeota archaeon]